MYKIIVYVFVYISLASIFLSPNYTKESTTDNKEKKFKTPMRSMIPRRMHKNLIMISIMALGVVLSLYGNMVPDYKNGFPYVKWEIEPRMLFFITNITLLMCTLAFFNEDYDRNKRPDRNKNK